MVSESSTTVKFKIETDREQCYLKIANKLINLTSKSFKSFLKGTALVCFNVHWYVLMFTFCF